GARWGGRPPRQQTPSGVPPPPPPPRNFFLGARRPFFPRCPRGRGRRGVGRAFVCGHRLYRRADSTQPLSASWWTPSTTNPFPPTSEQPRRDKTAEYSLCAPFLRLYWPQSG